MTRTKQLHICVTFNGTNLVINDLGEAKSPRFELYDTETKQVIKKSNNPLDFDDYVCKVLEKGGKDV